MQKKNKFGTSITKQSLIQKQNKNHSLSKKDAQVNSTIYDGGNERHRTFTHRTKVLHFSLFFELMLIIYNVCF